jgi:hypothetical protein
MFALGWIAIARRFAHAPRRRIAARNTIARTAVPRVEHLESLMMLSTAGLGRAVSSPLAVRHATLSAHRVAHVIPSAVPNASAGEVQSQAQVMASAIAPQTLQQTLTVPATLTNFTDIPLTQSPGMQPLALFNPALGTLTSVQISSQATLASVIQSQNTSRSSPATITGTLQGAYVLNGLSQPLSGTPSNTTAPVTVQAFQPPFIVTFQPPSGVTFPTLVASQSQSQTLTQASDLAFYTAAPGRTQISPTFSASATASASAPNGNLTTRVSTAASASVTVTYTYTPTCPNPPNVINVIHTGVHHQPTKIIITFDAPLDPVAAQNPQNYQLSTIGRNGQPGQPIAITSAVYDPANNTVTLTPDHHLNAHFKFQLTVLIPNISVCKNGSNFTTTFGGRNDLGPIIGHHGATFFLKPRGASTGRTTF